MMASTVGHAQILISPELNRPVLRRFEAAFKTAMNGVAIRNPLEVRLDTKGLRQEMQTKLAAATRGVKAHIPVELTGDKALAGKVKAATTMAERFARIEAKVDVDNNLIRNTATQAAGNFVRGFNQFLMRDISLRVWSLGALVALGAALGGALLSGLGGALMAGGGIAAIIAGAVLATASSQRLQTAGKDMARFVMDGLKSASQPMIAPMLLAINVIRDRFAAIQPVIRQIFTNVAPFILPFVDAVTTMASKMTVSFERLTRAIGPFMDVLFNWLSVTLPRDLDTFFSQIASINPQGFKDLLEALSSLLPILGELIVCSSEFRWNLKALFEALVPLAKALIALGAATLPILTAALRALAPVFDWVTRNANFVAPAIIGIVIATKLWAAAQAILNGVMLANPIGLVIAAIVAIGIALVAAYNHFEGFRNVVDAVFRAIAGVAIWLFDNILKPAFNWIVNTGAPAVGGVLSWLWNNIFKPVFTAIGTIAVWLFDNVLKP